MWIPNSVDDNAGREASTIFLLEFDTLVECRNNLSIERKEREVRLRFLFDQISCCIL